MPCRFTFTYLENYVAEVTFCHYMPTCSHCKAVLTYQLYVVGEWLLVKLHWDKSWYQFLKVKDLGLNRLITTSPYKATTYMKSVASLSLAGLPSTEFRPCLLITAEWSGSICDGTSTMVAQNRTGHWGIQSHTALTSGLPLWSPRFNSRPRQKFLSRALWAHSVVMSLFTLLLNALL